MPALLALVALAALIAGGATAPAPAPTSTTTNSSPKSMVPVTIAPTAAVSYVHLLGGEPFGEEGMEPVGGTPTPTLRGRVRSTIPGGTILEIDHTTTLSADGTKVVGYEADLRVAGRAIHLSAVPTERGWRLSAREGEAAPTVVEREASGPSVLVDNNMAGHLDLLCRGLHLEPGATTTLSAVVPQVLHVLPLKVTRLPDGRERLDGAERAVRHYRLEAASVLFEATCRAADGALLEAAVPVQKVAFRVKGYTPPVKTAAADARETVTTVASPVGSLPAVLTVPRGDGPFAAAVLLSGSGPNDRDETVGPNKPLRDLARALADRGIATLRFDKRTVAVPSAPVDTLQDEYVTDALAALELLGGSPKVDAGRLFVIGHSLGASVAPLVAHASSRVRGVVLMAPAVRRADLLVLDQIGYQLQLAGTDRAEVEQQVGTLRAQLDAIRGGGPDAPASLFGASAAYWRDLFALDVTASLRDLQRPALVLQGEKDFQVKVDADLAALRAGLGDAAGRIRIVVLPRLNHLFMPVEGASTGAEYAIEGTMDPAVGEAIAAWAETSVTPSPEAGKPAPPASPAPAPRR